MYHKAQCNILQHTMQCTTTHNAMKHNAQCNVPQHTMPCTTTHNAIKHNAQCDVPQHTMQCTTKYNWFLTLIGLRVNKLCVLKSWKWFFTASKLCLNYSQQTQNICITFVQRRSNFFDVSPTFCKCYTNVWFLQVWCVITQIRTFSGALMGRGPWCSG